MIFSEIAGDSGIFVDGDWIEKKDQDPNGKVRLIQLADIGEGHFLDKSNRFITESKAEELHCTFLEKGDILIARLGEPLCKACVFPYEGLYITAVDIAILRIDSDRINPEYIVYLVNSSWFKEAIKPYESGTTRKRISRKNLNRIDIDIPSIAKQNQVVSQIEESLSQLDSAVETLKKTKQQLEVYRQAVLKEAFSFESAEQKVEISEITDSIRIGPFGTMLHKSDYIVDGIPVINPQHIKNGIIVPSSKNSISMVKAEELNNYQLKTNDIIMGRRGEMGRSAHVTENENGWICGTGSIFFRLKSGFDAVLYSKILSSPEVVHYLEENATGTTMKNLNEDIVSHIPVPYIDKSKQNKIMQYLEEQLSVCEGIETTIYQSLQQAEALRQSILKQAFEGE